MKDNIICIGDSHVSFFSGVNEISPVFPSVGPSKTVLFRSYRVGAALAYNLIKEKSKEQGREKFLQIIDQLPFQSKLLLCFGEIDIRCHLIKLSKEKQRSLKEIVIDCVKRYISFIEEVKALGFEIVVLGPVPSSNNYDPDFPFFGSMQDRNSCTMLFNRILKSDCNDRSIPYICINHYLLTKSYKTKSEFFFDALHLSTLSLPFVKKELLKINFISKNGFLSRVELEVEIARSILLSKVKKINRSIRSIYIKK